MRAAHERAARPAAVGVAEDGEFAEVVPFPSRDDDERARDEAELQLVYGEDSCAGGHRRAGVHEPTRRLVCRDCGAELDPFDFLAELARDRERIHGAIRRLKGRREWLEGRVADLERLERNAKARLRTVRRALELYGAGQAAGTEMLVALRRELRGAGVDPPAARRVLERMAEHLRVR